jgi:hypothetical protein
VRAGDLWYRISANLTHTFFPVHHSPRWQPGLLHRLCLAHNPTRRAASAAVMAEQGGVGIVFHATRSGRCLLVSPVLFALPNAALTAAAAFLAAAAAPSRSAFPAYPLWVLNIRGHPCLRARPPAVAPVSFFWSAAIVLPAHSHSFGLGFFVHAR